MTKQTNRIDAAPRWVPSWPELMADLCQPTPHQVAQALGVSVRTAKRYNAAADAPRPVLLAVFWLTSWGRSAVNAQAENDAQLALGHMRALQRRVSELEARVRHLQAIGNFGAANDPTPTGRPGKRLPL